MGRGCSKQRETPSLPSPASRERGLPGRPAPRHRPRGGATATPMTHILRLLLPCLAASLLSLSRRAAEFTPAQRAEIVQILRDALKQDPSILRDAVGAMQADEGDHQRAALAAAQGYAGRSRRSGRRQPQGRRDDRRVLRHALPVLPQAGTDDGRAAGTRSWRAAGLQGPADPGTGERAGIEGAARGAEAGRLREAARRDHGRAAADHQGNHPGGGAAARPRLEAAGARHGRSGDPGADRCQPEAGAFGRHRGDARTGDRRRPDTRRGRSGRSAQGGDDCARGASRPPISGLPRSRWCGRTAW